MAGRLRWALRDGWIIAVRDMQQWVREPQMIVWGLLFPIMFVLLFAYVFGSGMIVPGGGNYREFLMAGMFAQTMAFGIGETAMAVQVDSAKGVMDRFRSMPMAPSAVVVGRCIAAMVYSAVSLAILVATGVAIGWRWHGSLGEAVAAFGLLLLLRLAFLWLGILLGLRARNAESVNSLYGLLYPVTMLSSAFIAVELMPAWLGAIATWNPLSATINATRELFGNPGVETAGWVADNSLLMAIVWPVVITAVTLPFAVRAYQGLFAVRRSHDHIEVRGARENNLREVDVDIPKGQLTVFTGVSGSGKSSLVFDTIAAESRRLFNETYTAFLQSLMPSPGRPDVDSLRNLSAAIVVDQERMGANSRSTVGTATDTYSMLRIVFSRIAEPHVGHANAFSFNDPAGMCEACEGLGRVDAIDVDAMVDREKSLDDGAITLPNFGVGTWYWQIFAGSGFFDTAKPLRDYTADEWDRFLYGAAVKVANSAGFNSTYEGLVPKFRRLFLAKDLDSVQAAHREAVERIATFADCPACGGARLNAAALSARIAGRNIAECAAMEVSDLAAFVASVDAPAVAPLLGLLADTLGHLVTIGLGYLSLDRESGSLSGGEAQRVKMVRHLGSSLTDITYVFDEPTVGLHPHDIARMNELLLQLRDKGNTVLVVEHEPAVIAVADHVVDLGPGAGPAGGTVVYQGDVAGLRRAGTRTGDHLERRQPLRTAPRRPTGHLRIEHAGLHNLRDVSVDVPLGVLTVVSGVAGSGKSSLVRGSLAGRAGVTMIDQAAIRGSRRSNPATYTGVLDPIRKAFASANKVKASLFSANSEGACPACKGIGVIYTDLVFMAGVTTPCEACEGKRFTADVLEYRLHGRDISEVRLMPVVEAQGFFTERAVRPMLDALVEVGLGYVVLGQPLTTLSGGERQRLKLAMNSGTSDDVIVLDEPTSGLHMADTDHLLGLLDRLVEAGRSVIVIEHDLDVVARADWVIDMGPGAGHHGGTVVFEGPPTALLECAASLTGQHLRRLCTCG